MKKEKPVLAAVPSSDPGMAIFANAAAFWLTYGRWHVQRREIWTAGERSQELSLFFLNPLPL